MWKVEMFQNFLKRLSVLAISLAVILSATPIMAQQCKLVYDKGEVVDRAIEIDGDVFMYFPMDKAVEMQKDLEKFKSMSREVYLLTQKAEALEHKADMKDEQVNFLRMEVKHFQDISLKALDSSEPDSLVDDPSVAYVAGVITAVGMFFLWEYARR